ncbi:hypothetical protein ACFQ1S_01410 [Kibdelosporangium lantanae]|uniref:Integrase n=1 Tax=Kibdelosporangium lantanae TaxID=1497396 RepID=A0ABW3M429_9PSEU
MTWITLGRGKFRTSYGGDVWLLVATPKGRKPWLLYTERDEGGRPVQGKAQEIGAPSAPAAQHAAELWLSLGKLSA